MVLAPAVAAALTTIPASPIRPIAWLEGLVALVVATYLASRIAGASTGPAVAIGLGATFGVLSTFVLALGAFGVHICVHPGPIAECPRAPLMLAFVGLVEVLCAIAFGYWLGRRYRAPDGMENGPPS
jgi:hypothetical protein